jgi:hypothetical protein
VCNRALNRQLDRGTHVFGARRTSVEGRDSIGFGKRRQLQVKDGTSVEVHE